MKASPGFFLTGLLLAAAACTTRTRPVAWSSSKPNLIGINIGGTADSMPDRPYADLIRVSREFMHANTNCNRPNRRPIDEDGWPMSCFSLVVWAGIYQLYTTYTL